jgi:hypothetical protein
MLHELQQQRLRIDLLQHDNISPIWVADARMAGVAIAAIGSPWYQNGNIIEYLRLNPEADKLSLVRIHLS